MRRELHNWRWLARTVALIVAVVASMAGPMLAQVSTAQVDVVVLDDARAPLPGAMVKLTSPGTGLVRTAFTNEKGSATLAAMPPGVYTLEVTLARLDLKPLLARVACPTLVLAAELDRLFPPEQARDLAAAIAGARFEIVAGSGHVLIQERPEDFTRHCLELLSSIAGSREVGDSPTVSGSQPPKE